MNEHNKWNPLVKRPYLGDANYYRLFYQLAAQLMNGEVKGRFHASHPGGTGQDEESAAQQAVDVVEVAERLTQRAQEMLGWYKKRTDEVRWWRPWDPNKLDAQEDRLKHFLSETVKPCAELVLAGALLDRDRPTEAERYADRIRTQAMRGTLSYRANYNLACYEVARGQDHFDAAREALDRAFGEIQGERRRELVRWAGSDPSLAAMRKDKPFKARFNKLISKYEIQEPT